jgi:Glycosyltransferase WbsX
VTDSFAFYFPQFYPIAENDEWWGPGFTDWLLVERAKPLFEGHQQPRVPLGGLYNQSSAAVLAQQASLASRFGLAGFNFYHYYFAGKVLLDAPVRNLLQQPDMGIEFMLTWANESWTRQWVGRPQDVLIEQKSGSDAAQVQNHYNYLRDYFHDKRYVKVAGCPVLCIYRPEIIANLQTMLANLSAAAKSDGFAGLHFLACRSFEVASAKRLYSGFDGIIDFNPRYCINTLLRGGGRMRIAIESALRLLPETAQAKLAALRSAGSKTTQYSVYQYADFVSSLKINKSSAGRKLDGYPPVYSSVFTDWDNTARYGDRATLFQGSTPELFAQACQSALQARGPKHQNWLFVNAWNEWSEAAYLEPDVLNGTAYLEALQRVIQSDFK